MPWCGTMNDKFAGAIPGEARWLYGPEKKMKIEHPPVLPAPLGHFRRNNVGTGLASVRERVEVPPDPICACPHGRTGASPVPTMSRHPFHRSRCHAEAWVI